MTLRINGKRLNETLQSTCTTWGALSNSTGMRRLALSQEDREVRDWLVAECKALGCEVKIDQMGNIFATRAGTSKTRKPIAMGSHLDTQPAGGRYDGILGVQAALEVLRTLNDHNIQTECSITLIDWTNEEGARFPGAMMCSGVWSTESATGLQACWDIKDLDGISMKQALEETGYLGPTPADYRENGLEAYFELHIEQGPILEASDMKVGVVTSVQGMKWFRVKVSGVEGHSGTTPMQGRSDALVTASRLITAVNDTARSTGLGVATVGVISNDTQSQATIPSGVEFIIDVRCSTDSMVEELSTAIFKKFEDIVASEANKTSYEVIRTWGLPESIFHKDCIEAVRSSAISEVGTSKIMEMKSGAGHDAAWTSKVVKSSMIFVPSKDGISHNPAEYTSPEDCSLGAQVLLGAVLRYDEGIKDGSIP
ncbi:related to N-carbamoyl-L-amino acid hydrolase [Phialocephala subalpina]|uniref:Related to N-carbamoyl-L-amino acid hydrolase n=1 Tax=Phialocephala subalpina TaxID=576137 RepID=A0A1L7WDI1_9HELO|nr:related to N-carbamoyl-L-amino acid hydrolase [Phialocephala subalpina]